MCARLCVLLTALAIPLLVSCEDEEMVKQSREQERQIQALRAELAMVKVKLDANWSKDLSRLLEEEEYAIEDLKGVISDLESELDQLHKDREKAEKAFNDYKAKYPVGL